MNINILGIYIRATITRSIDVVNVCISQQNLTAYGYVAPDEVSLAAQARKSVECRKSHNCKMALPQAGSQLLARLSCSRCRSSRTGSLFRLAARALVVQAGIPPDKSGDSPRYSHPHI